MSIKHLHRLKTACQEGQSLMVGSDIRLKICAIYRKKDGTRFVQVELCVPDSLPVFKEDINDAIHVPLLSMNHFMMEENKQ